MRLSSATLTLIAALFIIGCATKAPPITPAEQKLEKKDVHEYNKEIEGRVQ
jgi:hypothetical protein